MTSDNKPSQEKRAVSDGPVRCNKCGRTGSDHRAGLCGKCAFPGKDIMTHGSHLDNYRKGLGG